MNTKNIADIIRDNYSLDPKSPKWLSKGGDILKYIGSPVVLVNFTKKSKEDKWTNTTSVANIESISDWDPMTKTYKCIYTVENNSEKIEKRIIPEGFVFNNPDEDLWAIRFVPYSLHMAMAEEETFYNRLNKVYKDKKMIPIEQINQLIKNTESLTILNYIAAVIDTENGLNCGICSFRVNSFTNPIYSKKDNSYSFGIKDMDNNYYPCKWNQNEDFIKLYSNGKFIGNLKIFDIED